MLYPVYVHVGDDTHAHGITVPDFPGCYSAADSWDELPAKVQEAIEVYCGGEDMDIPAPTPAGSPRRPAGIPGWRVDAGGRRCDPTHDPSSAFELSLPEGLVKRIDAYAKAHHLSRSGFLAKAAVSEMERLGR